MNPRVVILNFKLCKRALKEMQVCSSLKTGILCLFDVEKYLSF